MKQYLVCILAGVLSGSDNNLSTTHSTCGIYMSILSVPCCVVSFMCCIIILCCMFDIIEFGTIKSVEWNLYVYIFVAQSFSFCATCY